MKNRPSGVENFSVAMRNVKILRSQFRDLPIKEFLYLLKQTLFFNQAILVYKKDLSPGIQTLSEIDGIRIEKGNFDDLEQTRLFLNPLPWEFQCHEFDGVRDFFVAKEAGYVRHISWIYYQEHRNRLLSLGADEAEIKFCLTLPALRGRGIYPRVLLAILKHLASTGKKRAFICVHQDNFPSIRGIEKSGFERVGEIQLRKVAGFQITPRIDTVRRLP